MEGHVAKNNESTFPSLGELDNFLNKHNSNFIWLLVGKSVSVFTVAKVGRSVDFILEHLVICDVYKV